MEASDRPDCGRADTGKLVTETSSGAAPGCRDPVTGLARKWVEPGRYSGPITSGSEVGLATDEGVAGAVATTLAIGGMAVAVAGASVGAAHACSIHPNSRPATSGRDPKRALRGLVTDTCHEGEFYPDVHAARRLRPGRVVEAHRQLLFVPGGLVRDHLKPAQAGTQRHRAALDIAELEQAGRPASTTGSDTPAHRGRAGPSDRDVYTSSISTMVRSELTKRCLANRTSTFSAPSCSPVSRSSVGTSVGVSSALIL